MVASLRDAQTISRHEKIDYLVRRFHDMAASPELRGKLHEYFWRLTIDQSVPHFSITSGTKPVSDDNLVHVREALERAEGRRLESLFEFISSIPEPVGRRSETPQLGEARPA